MQNIRFCYYNLHGKLKPQKSQAGAWQTMFYVSQIQTTAPRQFQTPLQETVYRGLEALQIPFERVDTDEAVTMQDCAAIEKALCVKMVKTL